MYLRTGFWILACLFSNFSTHSTAANFCEISPNRLADIVERLGDIENEMNPVANKITRFPGEFQCTFSCSVNSAGIVSESISCGATSEGRDWSTERRSPD